MTLSPFARLLVVSILSFSMLTACSKDEPETEAAAETTPVEDSGTAEPTEPVATQRPTVSPSEPLPEVLVLQGLDGVMEWLDANDWWGPEERGTQLSVPYIMITAIHPSWKEASAQIPVAQKKEIFYRMMLPLVMHANKMVTGFREDLLAAQKLHAATGKVSAEQLVTIRRAAFLLPGSTEEEAQNITADHPEMPQMLDALIYRVDIIPAGLALGQAAYESGYGTSRFATEGNSLFGQWTYKGDGLKPREHRASKGDYRVKAFEWPFDSVRGYYINLMSHPAYEDFRRLRAELRAAGKPLDSMTLADGLIRYSERGKEYVDSLKGIMRVNKLDLADNAVFRDEPMRFMVSEQTAEDVVNTKAEIERLRQSGELAQIIERMRLD